jgi:hypothetical protein
MCMSELIETVEENRSNIDLSRYIFHLWKRFSLFLTLLSINFMISAIASQAH